MSAIPVSAFQKWEVMTIRMAIPRTKSSSTRLGLPGTEEFDIVSYVENTKRSDRFMDGYLRQTLSNALGSAQTSIRIGELPQLTLKSTSI